MDLMTLAAKITLDDRQFTQGVGKAEKMGQQLAGKMSAMTVAVGNLAADMVRKGVQAISSVINGAIDGYADYQQLIGGVETLFKTSASKVSAYAKQSYKTTGLSANQYMETVTSFSASLLQGLKGDTETAADMANMAVTDMADNANKMGTDIGSIQNAYQGFAKQNYTMLDNLKLGYGGTREEMVRLVNESGILDHKISDLDGITFDQLVQAIHEIQVQMGITGTTAEEAEQTISGSAASMKAAWQDMLTAVAGNGEEGGLDVNQAVANFQAQFSKYMENFAPTLVKTIAGSGTLVQGIAGAIADLPVTLLSEAASAATEGTTGIIGGVTDIVDWLINSITEMFKSASANPDDIQALGAAIGDFLGTAIKDIVVSAPDILKGIVDIGINLAGGLLEGLFKGLFGEDSEVEKIQGLLTDSITDAEVNATKSGAIISYLKTLAEQYGNAATETLAWKEAVAELKESMPESEGIFKEFSGDVQTAIDVLDGLNKKMRETAMNNALQKALSDENTLLFEQRLEYNKQNARYNRNKNTQDQLTDAAIQAIMENAQAQLDAMTEEQLSTNMGQSRANKLRNLAAGKDDVTGQVDLRNFSLSDLGAVLSQDLEVEKIDFQGMATSVDSLQDVYNEAGEEMRQASESMKAMADEIKATEAAIKDTEAAVAASIAEWNGAATDVDTASSAAAAAIEAGGETLGSKLASLRVPVGYIPGVAMPRATGMDYVPYTGFRAELHRGEAILTKAEADKYRGGSGVSEVVGAIQSLNSNIQNMQLVVGQKAFGRAVVGNGGGRMNNYIGQAESRRASGYGT